MIIGSNVTVSWQLVPLGNSIGLGAFGKMSGSHCRRFRPSPHPLPLLLILPLFRSFPPVRERLEKERKRLLRRLHFSELYQLHVHATMGFLTHDQKARIIRLWSNGKGAFKIVRILAEDDIKISSRSIIRFLKRYQERQSLENAPKSGCPPQGVWTSLTPKWKEMMN